MYTLARTIYRGKLTYNIDFTRSFYLLLQYITMTTPKPVQGGSNFTTFNIRHGFAEALVRGMRSSFLSDQDYNHLIQCETLEDVRLNLTETDYADAIADFTTLTPAMLQKAAVEKVGVIFYCITKLNSCQWSKMGFCLSITILSKIEYRHLRSFSTVNYDAR